MASGEFREVLPFARHGRHSNDDICIACCEKQTNRPFADPGDWHEGSSVILARRLGHSELKQPRPNFLSDHLQSPQPVLVCCFSSITCPFSSIEPSLIYSTPLIFKLWSKKDSRVWCKWDSSQEIYKTLLWDTWFLPPLTFSYFVYYGSHWALYLTFHQLHLVLAF